MQTQPTFTCSNSNKRNTGKKYEKCSKLTIKTPEQRIEQVNIDWKATYEQEM